MEESVKKKGVKKAKGVPKKTFTSIISKIDTGVKKSLIAASASSAARVSFGESAKKKDELFGRISSDALAKFLMQKYT